jgi:hypothetical protein
MIPTSNLRQASIVPKTLAVFFHVPQAPMWWANLSETFSRDAGGFAGRAR